MNVNPNIGRILIAAGISGAIAVILGAFSAHGLEDYLLNAGLDDETTSRRLSQFETGVRYHLLHSILILSLAALPIQSVKAKRRLCLLIGLGCVLFSGSLYLLVFLNLPILGAITPLGGLSWIVGWCWIAWIGKTQLS